MLYLLAGNAFAMAQPQGHDSSSPASAIMGLVPIVAMFLIFYFLLIRPQQKKQKDHRTMIDNIKEGDNIITTCGMYGLITKIKGDVLTLQIAENVKVKIAKHGIAGLKES